MDKAVKFADDLNKDSKGSNKTSENKIVKTNNKRNTTSTSTVIEIQTSSSKQDTDVNENDSNSISWNHLSDIVMTSESSDRSDRSGTDETE